MAKPPPPIPPPGSLGARAVNVLAWVNVAAYRLSKGRLGGRMEGLEVCILHTVGRRSGKARQTPLLYLQDGEDVVLVASRGGSDAMPAWYLNLMAMPETMVEIKGAKRRMRPRKASPEEKAALWPRLVEGYQHYDVYQSRTARDIPVVIMTPVV